MPSTSIYLNNCTYHEGAYAEKVQITANRAVWRCSECLAEEEWARADYEAEMRNERFFEERGWGEPEPYDEEQAMAMVDHEPENPNACSGGVCKDILRLCSRHSAEYQREFGRASNE